MRIAVGSDDRTSLTDAVLENVKKRGLELDVFGALKEGSDRAWPEVALRVGQEAASGRCRPEGIFLLHWNGRKHRGQRSSGNTRRPLRQR